MTPDDPEADVSADDAKAYFESRGEKLPSKETQEKPDAEEKEAETETDETVLDDKEPDSEAKDEPKKDFVPLKTLLSERDESKKAKTALQEMEKRYAVMEDRWNTLLASTQPPEEQPKKPTMADIGPEPDKTVDIFKWADWTAKRQAIQDDMIAELVQVKEQTAAEKQAEEGVRVVRDYWREDASAYNARNPDFAEAATWMANFRDKQLEVQGELYPPFSTKAGRDRQIDNELMEIVVMSARKQISPAEYIYNMAKRVGYQPKAKTDDGKTVETLAKNLEAETSLSGVGGSKPGGATTAQDVANMSPDEFDRWLTKHGAAGFKRLQTRGTA